MTSSPMTTPPNPHHPGNDHRPPPSAGPDGNPPEGDDPRVRAVIIDDTTLYREWLGSAQGQINVIAGYSTIEPVLAELPRADLVILDLQLVGLDHVHVRQGKVAIRALARAGYRVCVYTQEQRRFVLAACLKAGATGIVHKSDPMSEAVAAFQAVADGDTVITKSLIGLAEILDRDGRFPELTQRQREVLAARARGESWDSIADRLHITKATARDHWDAVTAKVGDYFRSTAPADIEHDLGLAPGDIFDEEK